MDTKNRQKMLFIVVGVIVGLLVANSVIVQPLIKAWDNGQAKIKKLKEDVEKDNSLIRREAKLQKRWSDIQKYALTNDVAAAQSALLNAISRWQTASRVNIESLAPNPKEEMDDETRDPIKTLECRIDATGSMTSILNFLYAIETEKMGLKLDNIEIASKDSTGRELSLSVTLSALILEQDSKTQQTAAAPKTEAEQL